MNLNQLTKPHDFALGEAACIRASEKSIGKRPYPDGKKFTIPDLIRLAAHAPVLVKTMASLRVSLRLAKNRPLAAKRFLQSGDWEQVQNTLARCGVASIGYLTLAAEDLYQGKGCPYPKALVLTVAMRPTAFATAPSMEAQLEVMRVYAQSGAAANELCLALRGLGFNAVPNHSMGGVIDYAKAGAKAGLGAMGRHGMLITPEAGACPFTNVPYQKLKEAWSRKAASLTPARSP